MTHTHTQTQKCKCIHALLAVQGCCERPPEGPPTSSMHPHRPTYYQIGSSSLLPNRSKRVISLCRKGGNSRIARPFSGQGRYFLLILTHFAHDSLPSRKSKGQIAIGEVIMAIWWRSGRIGFGMNWTECIQAATNVVQQSLLAPPHMAQQYRIHSNLHLWNGVQG